MKRYWLFCFERYYPYGGMHDLWNHFETIKECHDEYEKKDCIKSVFKDDYYQIFDSKNNIIVFDSNLPEKGDVYKLQDYSKPLTPQLKIIYPKKLWNE